MISIIVPVYKAQSYLEYCVKSILNQSYKDLEVILVDDGSPDECPEMCDHFARLDKRIKVVHKNNGGVSTARNAGLEIASGEYIAFVDSDDWIEPYMFEKMINIANQYNCDVVMCDCIKEYRNYNKLYSHEIRGGFYNKEQLVKEYYPHLLIMENIEYPASISNCTMLWKKNLNDSSQRYPIGVRYSEDLLFGAKLLRKASSFYYLKNEALYHYRMNPMSASHSFSGNKWENYKLLYNYIITEFGADSEFSFLNQIDRCLLFFLYNTIGEIYGAEISRKEKRQMILQILNDRDARKMLKELKIFDLSISWKQKIITIMYRIKLGIFILIYYYERRFNE